MLDVVRHIEAGEVPKGGSGRPATKKRRIVFNARRELRPFAELPPKAYHLADFDAYERVCGRRWAMYTAAWRVPTNCGYCTNNAGVRTAVEMRSIPSRPAKRCAISRSVTACN
jgi:hypothetical protein